LTGGLLGVISVLAVATIFDIVGSLVLADLFICSATAVCFGFVLMLRGW
jgi:hypothetical protein